MLVRLSPAETRLGMFIHSFEGHWTDWPFWQSGFLLGTQDDLERLRTSRIDFVLVDTARGLAPVKRGARSIEEPALPRRSRSAPAASTRSAQTIAKARRSVLKLADDVRLGRPIAVAQLAPLVAELAEEVENNSAAILGLLRIKNRDQYTYLHSVAVAALMMNLARAMDMDPAQLPDIGMAGLLHDVGKIDMPDSILNKPGSLSDLEFSVMRSHPRRGYEVLQRSVGVPAIALDVCLHHHERPDGRGYPEGVSGERLSLAARMGAVCDVYDALTSDRAYKNAWAPQRALAAMQSWEGQFDPLVLRAFMRSLGIFPIGSLVRVRDSMLAVVLTDNDEQPTCPTVRSFYSIATRSRVHSEDIAIKSAHLLTLEDPANWGFQDWPALMREVLSDERGMAAPASRLGEKAL